MRPRDRVDEALTVLDEDTVRRLRGERVDCVNLIGDFRQRGLESTKTYVDAVAKVAEIDATLAGGQASVVDEVAFRCREHARRIDAAANALADALADGMR